MTMSQPVAAPTGVVCSEGHTRQTILRGEAVRHQETGNGPKHWTDEQTDLLRALWSEGKSNGEMATALGLSLHAVKAKIYRLHLKAARPSLKRLRTRRSQTAEAERRGMTLKQLQWAVWRTVARDNLYAAVLDD